ncbi:MAG: cyclopropane-fatty-acyl-phospholipid synthase family protein [Oleiphilaceae bacterium]|nr:cyclopropane-fatty-acyl-phospholipid synthase family protein [Oleiphilaceae bacterium]
MENIDINNQSVSPGRLDRLARKLVLAQLSQIRDGELSIHEGHESHHFGEPASDGLSASLSISDSSCWRDMLTGGSIGAAEAYVAGDWSSPDLTALLRLFARNVDRLNQFEDRYSWLTKPALKALHWANRNSETGSRKNIEAHYDLGNDLFERFLDSSMMYSAAIFPSDDSTLEQAQFTKLDRICQKLALTPTDHVVEIGTGWGGFALHAARHYGCHVTTTTISREQYDWAAERIREQGLEDRITLLFEDYRKLTGRFDKLVSIEMIEAVGPQYLPTYIRTVSQLLKEDGLALIQAITLPEQRYQRALKNVDFIQRHIFPGSFIPSLAAILESTQTQSDLVLTHLEDIGFHYARTLACWRERFLGSRQALHETGYNEAFVRLWDFYFCYCEAGFAERAIGDAQLLFAKPRNKRPNLVTV